MLSNVELLANVKHRRGVCMSFRLLAIGALSVMTSWQVPTANGQVLDRRAQLESQTFWDNRDWDWYEDNIPFFECPNESITTTYYYRWELLTKHLTYGSPNTGYTFTEFIDRPFWSGAYGSISCPAGHQLYEARWLRNPRIAKDCARYWLRTPGAEPRRYSTWLADSVWAIHTVHQDQAFAVDLLKDLVNNFKLWERRHFTPEVGLFWQTGHDDGMEININSRQTQDTVRGAPGYRPTLNSYMWADALAIARIATLAEEDELATEFLAKASQLKKLMQQSLWDDERQFFFPMSKQREERGGHVVEPLTLTYETGKFTGSSHGRELIGYVPWQFGMPDDEARFAEAWKFLMDPDFFAARFGPTTVEQNDPQFVLKEHCCWWSGQSWPYATTQTIKAMANLLHDYDQNVVSRADYLDLLETYTRSHRKDGQPYLAEALHPHTGSFAGHDNYNHSEHYFHSGYCDLIITGLVGLRPHADDRIEVDPLAPSSWDYFALDQVRYHGHDVSVVWDRDGNRYQQGSGLQIFVDNELVARADSLKRVIATLPESPQQVDSDLAGAKTRTNFAVNNDGEYYPRVTVSSTGLKSSTGKLIDGNYWYHIDPPNRWTSAVDAVQESVIEINLGVDRPIDTVALYFLDDQDRKAEETNLVAPNSYRIETWSEEQGWERIPNQVRDPIHPVGHRPNLSTFPVRDVSRLRFTLEHAKGRRVGLTEIECWGDVKLPIESAPAPEGNLAFNRGDKEFPKVTASHTSRFDKLETVIDGRVVYSPTPANRWTSYESKSTSDWLQLEFDKPETVGRVVLHIYDDGGGVQTPDSYQVETFSEGEWRPVRSPRLEPETPTGSTANAVSFDPVKAKKLRIVFRHRGKSRSGLTELEVWRE